MSLRYGVIALLFAAAACGDDSQSPAKDLAANDLTAANDLAGVDLAGADLAVAMPPDLAINPVYPAGPYGNTVGAIIPPLVWEGYADPLGDALATTKAYGTYSMNDMRISGGKFGIVHVSSFT